MLLKRLETTLKGHCNLGCRGSTREVRRYLQMHFHLTFNYSDCKHSHISTFDCRVSAVLLLMMSCEPASEATPFSST